MSTAPMASYWLLPAAADEAMFTAEVRRLAARHASPVFHPHLTLLGDLPRDPARLAEQTRAIAATASAFSAPVADVVTGTAFFRSFYALFQVQPPLAALRAQAAALFAVDPGPFMPHVSLLYGPVEAAAKEASAAEVRQRLAGRVIRFDRLALTNSANDVPIEDWRLVDVVPLSG